MKNLNSDWEGLWATMWNESHVLCLEIFSVIHSIGKRARRSKKNKNNKIKSMCLKMTLLGDSFGWHFFNDCFLMPALTFKLHHIDLNDLPCHFQFSHNSKKPTNFNGQKLNVEMFSHFATTSRSKSNPYDNTENNNYLLYYPLFVCIFASKCGKFFNNKQLP